MRSIFPGVYTTLSLATIIFSHLTTPAFANSNQCSFPTAESEPADFKKLKKDKKHKELKESFLKWITPHALKIQKQTKFPAGVLIAQAIEESGWGARAPGNNLFGIKCEKKNHEYHYEPTDKVIKPTGCQKNGYAKFATLQESLYAHVTKSLYQSPKGKEDIYKKNRKTIKGWRETDIKSETIASNIGEWATGFDNPDSAIYKKYVKSIKGHISSNGLAQLDQPNKCAKATAARQNESAQGNRSLTARVRDEFKRLGSLLTGRVSSQPLPSSTGIR